MFIKKEKGAIAMDPQHVIDEIKDNVLKKDFIKARLIMSEFSTFEKATQNKVLYELFKGDNEFTINVISILLSTCGAECRSLPIIRETMVAKLLESPSVLEKFLKDDSISDKSQFIDLAGEIGMEEALPILTELLTKTKSNDIILHVIRTMGSIGDPQVINTLSDYLYSGDRDLIIAAIQALGNIGTPTAMRRLSERMGTDINIDMVILKVFSKVQDHISLDKLNEMISSHHAHLRNFAKDNLVKIGAKSVPFLIDNLMYDDPDMQIHTLNILGEIGDESVIKPIRKLLYSAPRNPNVRFAAYEALSMLPVNRGAFMLIGGLQDPEESVAIAAAKAVEENFNEILAAGIRNLIKAEDDVSEKICKTIIDAQVGNIFAGVAAEKYFQNYAVQYLPTVHSDIRDYYIGIMKKNDIREILSKITLQSRPEKSSFRIIAVDDSRMILNIYKNTLHKLGFSPTLFEFPESALEHIMERKPDIVLTDLNMPELNGVQLTEKIRKKYSADELPVIMVTTQNDAQDSESVEKAGISRVLFKPFSAEKLHEAMSAYLDIPELES